MGNRPLTAAEALRLVTDDPAAPLSRIFRPNPTIDEVEALNLRAVEILTSPREDPRLTQRILPRLPHLSEDELARMHVEATIEVDTNTVLLHADRAALQDLVRRVTKSVRRAPRDITSRLTDLHRRQEQVLRQFEATQAELNELRLTLRVIEIEVAERHEEQPSPEA